MAKVKIHEIAKELGKQSKEILSFLQEKGIEAKVAQSSVESETAEMVKKHFGGVPASDKQQPAKAAPKAAPKAEPKAAPKEAPKAEPKAASKAEPKAEKKTEDSVSAPEKRAKAKETQDAPKKKKKIIFVSNPQNSRAPGQQGNRPQTNTQGRGTGGARPSQNTRGGQQAPVRPIKPLTPPSPIPSVAMTPPAQTIKNTVSKNSAKESLQTQAENTVQQTDKISAQAKESVPARTERRPQSGQGYSQNRPQSTGYNQNRPQSGQGGYNQNRPQGQDGYSQNRPQGQGGYSQNRPQGQGGYSQNRPQSQGGYSQNRPQGQGGYSQNRPQGQGGYGQSRPQGGQGGYGQNRPQGQGGYGQNRTGGARPGGGYAGQGGYRGNNANTGGDKSYGGGRDNFRKPGQVKETTIKPTDNKHREEKRRISQEKDKRSRKDFIYEKESAQALNKPGRFIKPEKKREEAVEEVIKVIVLPETITIKELADKMKIQSSSIIKKLFLEGKIVTLNQEVSYEEAEVIAMEYEILCEKEVKIDVIEELLKEEEEQEEEKVARSPVICVMGHVDHGKTSLLDAIRKTKVTDREAGGITQHIGAYTVSVDDRKITFLDTPGHEAFTAMRMRGANSTDIAILVVAADDGVMPQTVEAINHAKAAGIEIIVAVNKIDKPSANVDRVKQELTEYELIPVDWGGTTEFVQVSAKTGDGIDDLLETIVLTADILELKANPDRRGRGLVIEAELDKGRGPVATVLVQKGTLHVGDFISAGASYGKVRAMIDDRGRKVKEAGPSTPVEILGLSDVPSAGEVFISHDNDKTAKSFAETYLSQNKERMLEETKSKMSLDDLFSQIKEGNLKELNLIVKADVQGSVEAVKQSLLKLSNEEVVVKCIHGGVGAINESDVMLASASSAIIIGFNVRPDVTAKTIAEREGVDVRQYKVIYQAIEDIEAAMKGMLDPVFEEKVIGHAEVRQIFKASAVGNIAGSYVLDGMLQRGAKVRISREGKQIFEGQLASLKRFKDDVKEVKAGFECGLVFDGFDQIQELDIVEAYIMVEVPR